MGHRGESTSISYTLKAIGIAMAVLLLLILGAIWFGPEKPEQPAVSVITFEPPPPPESTDFQFEPIDESRPSRAGNSAKSKEVIPNDIVAEGHPLTGIVRDSKTGEPVPDVTVQILWNRTPEELEIFEREHKAVLTEKSEDMGDALDDVLARLGNQISTTSLPDGSYEILVPQDRVLSARFEKHRYIPASYVDLYYAAQDDPGQLDATLSNGASVSGRVISTDAGIEGMYINIRNSRIDDIASLPNDEETDMIVFIEGEYTDADGRYRIAGLVPGDYEIDVVYRNTRYKPGRTLPFQRINISYDDEERQNVDFTLNRGGLVWGYTVDPQDKTPIQTNLFLVGPENMITQGINAFFTAAFEGEDEVEFYGGTSDSDKKGYYEIVGIPLNREWQVYAISKDRAPQLSDPFILTESNLDVRIDMNMFDGTSIIGKVVDTKGRPISEAEVFCIPQFSEIFSPFNSAKTFREDTSDIDGNFTLNDMPAGSYQIYAFKKGFKYTVTGDPVFPDGYRDITNKRIVLIPVDHGEHTIFGQVTDSQGRAISGVMVNLAGGSLASLDFSDRSVETDSRGEYLFEGVSLGKYLMNLEKEGYPGKNIIKVYLDRPTDVVMVDAILVRGRVLVRETNRPPDQAYTVTASAALEIKSGFLEQIQNAVSNSSFGASRTFSEPDGSFELPLTAGNYTLTARSADFVPDRTTLNLEAGSPPSDIILYISSTGAVVEGYVRTIDGASPQGANVVLRASSDGSLNFEDLDNLFSAKSYRVGADGVFRFEKLSPGEYTIHARHSGYANGESAPIEVREMSRISGVEVRLTQGGSLEGYVYDGNEILPNIMVMVISANSPSTTTTDANGFYFFDGLSPGNHEITAMSVILPNIDIFNTEIPNLIDTDTVLIEEGKVTRFDIRK